MHSWSTVLLTKDNVTDVAKVTGKSEAELVKMLIIFNHLPAVKVPYNFHKAWTNGY